ncbi:MAG: hypothetical protein ABSA75_13500 [Candidatus Bathyarchaeia archaeon]|jgi:hypothetical protein
MIESITILTVISLGLTIVGVVFGKKWNDAEGKASSILQDLYTIVVAAKDNQVNEADFQKLVDDIKSKL